MTRDAIKTLFYPVASGDIPVSDFGERVLFLGAEPGFRVPHDFSADLTLVQGFRPDFLGLNSSGYRVVPRVEGDGYDAALVLCGRHRGQNERHVADALERVRADGLIVVAGAKEIGIGSLRKRVSELVPLAGQTPKFHGVAFWFRKSGDTQSAIAALRAGSEETLVEDRFRTAPGMFSHDRIDTGSKLLAESLPGDLAGVVADFCAGWGYLAAELLVKSPAVGQIDLYEADFESLEAARSNLSEIRPAVRKRYFWHDLVAEPVPERYDAIIMNPPFHKGNAADPAIGQQMIKSAAGALRRGGRLFIVANRQLPYEATLNEVFGEHREISRDSGFKVLSSVRRR